MFSLEMGKRLMAKVIVVGGGFAGIAAATALAEKGINVELLESRGFLGGRVYSTENPSFPAPLDNGPHLFMGCYHETWKLFKRLNCSGSFKTIDPLRLSWLLPGGQKASFQCAPLPAPFHLIWGLFTTNAFPWKEKISLIKALIHFSQTPFKIKPEIKTISQFMNFTDQGPRSRELFWIPLCNAVMNVSVDVAPILGFGEVLYRVFFGNRHNSSLVLADKPLSEIGFKKVPVYLKNHQGSVHFHEGVQSFKVSANTFEVITRSGQTYCGDALIWAVPPTSLTALWPKNDWQAIQTLPQLDRLQNSYQRPLGRACGEPLRMGLQPQRPLGLPGRGTISQFGRQRRRFPQPPDRERAGKPCDARAQRPPPCLFYLGSASRQGHS